MSKIKHRFYENLAGLPHVTCPCLFVRAIFSDAVHVGGTSSLNSAREIGSVTWSKCGVIHGHLTTAAPRSPRSGCRQQAG